MKFIFNKKSETSDRRFIRLDGSTWDSKGLGRFVSRTENQITLLGALGVVAFTLATEGRLDIVNSQILHNAGAMVVGSLGVGVFFDYLFVKHSQESPWNKTIDTAGRSFPSQNFNVDDLNFLEAKRSWGAIMCGLYTLGAGQSIFISMAADLLFLDAVTGMCLQGAIIVGGLSYRSHKLIKGHSGEENGYIFTDDTPSKKEKSKNSIFSFLRKPAPSA